MLLANCFRDFSRLSFSGKLSEQPNRSQVSAVYNNVHFLKNYTVLTFFNAYTSFDLRNKSTLRKNIFLIHCKIFFGHADLRTDAGPLSNRQLKNVSVSLYITTVVKYIYK